MKTAKHESVRKLEPYSRLLPCKLTEIELLKYGGELAQVRQDILTEEKRQSSMKQELKARLAGLEARSSELSSKVARGEEARDVTVRPQLDFNDGMYFEIRSDTTEKISERSITEDERQENLGFVDDKPRPKKQPAEKVKTKDAKQSPAGAVANQ